MSRAHVQTDNYPARGVQSNSTKPFLNSALLVEQAVPDDAQQLQEALRRSEANFHHVFSNNPLPMWVYDATTLKFLAVNDAAVASYGYSRAEFMRMRITDIRSEQDLPHLFGALAQHHPGQQSSSETRHLLKSGQFIDVHVTSHVIEYEGRTAALVVAQDITESKQARISLMESEERLRLLTTNARDIIYRYRISPEPGFEYVSPAVTNLTGYTPDEYYADPDLGIRLLPQEDIAAFNSALDDPAGMSRPIVLRWPRKDGTIFWAELTNTPVYDEGKLVAVEGIGRDISERKAYEQKLKEHVASQTQLLHQLLNAQEAERRRLAMDIHDGPLQSLGVCLVALDRSMRRCERQEYDLLRDELAFLRSYMTETVEDVRNVLKDLSLEVLSNYGLVVALQSHIETFSDATGVKVELESTLNRRLVGDVELLVYRLAQESLSNVRKHAQASAVKVALGEEAGMLVLTIRDNGIGFDIGKVERNYEDGKRLGLRSMRQRVQAAGGDLEIISAPREGTTLRFTCPVQANVLITSPLKLPTV